MAWVRHDDTYSDRPEIAALSDSAFRDHFRLVEYVCRYVTDGRIPKAITDRVRTMHELLSAGLYGEEVGYYVLGGWREHALSVEQVDARKAAGKAGGLAKARRLPEQKTSKSHAVPVPAQTDGLAKARNATVDSRLDGGVSSKGSTVPVPVPVPVPEKDSVATQRCPAEAGPGKPRADSNDIDLVLEHYRSLHPKARPGAKERNLVAGRLGEGYSALDLQAAIDGNHRDPHCCGQNDRGAVYHDLTLIFRDSSHVQRYLAVPPGDNGSIRAASGLPAWLEALPEGAPEA